MTVTQHHIAQKLGLNQRTVSIAFGASGRINSETRRLILQAAGEMGYRPNRLAAGLRGAQTRSIGVIWAFVDPWAGDAVIGLDILERMQRKGFATYQSQNSDDVKVLCRQLDELLARRVDAIVIQTIPKLLEDPEVVSRLELAPAVVAVARDPIEEFEGDLVVHNRSEAIRQVVDHFAKTGRKRPAMALEMGVESNPPKFEVFCEQCFKHGIAEHANMLIKMEPPTEVYKHGNLHLAAFRRQFPDAVDVDAIFCFNDIGSLYIMHELQDRGIKVPEDVAVVGFNDIEAGRIWRPPLATGARKPRQVADAVDQMLEKRLAEPGLPRQRETVNMEFIWRESAG